MKPFGRNLRWVADHQYSDYLNTKMIIPSSGHNRGKRRRRYMQSFKSAARIESKNQIRNYEY